MREQKNPTKHSTRRAYHSGRTAARRVDRCCSARQLCARCSLMKVIQYRFEDFRRTFGRDPQPNEPLFFAADCSYPQQAEAIR